MEVHALSARRASASPVGGRGCISAVLWSPRSELGAPGLREDEDEREG